MPRELLQIRVNEASKCSKMKISKFQSVGCENYSKLEINLKVKHFEKLG